MATLGYNVVLFGGEFYKAGYELAPAETWIWNGTTWSSYTGTPQPSARYYASMATFGNEVLLFGGFNGSTALGDTWVWNGSGWAQQSVSGGPIARCGHALVSR
jgi:hypothetical protein